MEEILNTAQGSASSSKLDVRPTHGREAPLFDWQAMAPWSTAPRSADDDEDYDAADPGTMPHYLGAVLIVLAQVTMLWLIL